MSCLSKSDRDQNTLQLELDSYTAEHLSQSIQQLWLKGDVSLCQGQWTTAECHNFAAVYPNSMVKHRLVDMYFKSYPPPGQVSILYFLAGSEAIAEIQSIKNQTHILRVGDDSWISSL